MPQLGRHVIADLSGLPADVLRDADRVMGLVRDALQSEGFTILKRTQHVFDGPGGFTGFFLLAESHAAIHTYPEHGYLALDVFGCGAGDAQRVVDALVTALHPEHVKTRTLARATSDQVLVAPSTSRGG